MLTDFSGSTLANIAISSGFSCVSIDEEINGLFLAGEVGDWHKNDNDSPENILRIEASYKGLFPHL